MAGSPERQRESIISLGVEAERALRHRTLCNCGPGPWWPGLPPTSTPLSGLPRYVWPAGNHLHPASYSTLHSTVHRPNPTPAPSLLINHLLSYRLYTLFFPLLPLSLSFFSNLFIHLFIAAVEIIILRKFSFSKKSIIITIV